MTEIDGECESKYHDCCNMQTDVDRLRERAKRAEAQVMREVQLREAQSGEYRAALARVRALRALFTEHDLLHNPVAHALAYVLDEETS